MLRSPRTDDESCPYCVAARGLCDRHHAGVLPQLAVNLGWLRLMGDALIEQRTRQAPLLGRRDVAAIEKAKRRAARKHARMGSGLRGLLIQIGSAA